MAEHFHEHAAADFTIAEDLWVFNNDGAERYVCDPTRSIGRVYDEWTIEDARDFEPGMKAHLASGPPNRAFCLAVGRTRAATGADQVDAVRQMGAVWFLANAGYWTPATDYADGCRGSFWKKAKCKAGIGDCSQCGDDSTCGDGVCDGDETDGNCGQDCGCEAVACGEVAPFGCFCDAGCDESGDCCSDQDDCDD